MTTATETAYTLTYIDERGTRQLPGCSEAEATFESYEAAEAAAEELEGEWGETEWRIEEIATATASLFDAFGLDHEPPAAYRVEFCSSESALERIPAGQWTQIGCERQLFTTLGKAQVYGERCRQTFAGMVETDAENVTYAVRETVGFAA